jgi:hypothetical protein
MCSFLTGADTPTEHCTKADPAYGAGVAAAIERLDKESAKG